MLLAGAGELEGVAHDPVAAAPREHRFLHRHFVFGAAIEPAADFRVFALVVLAHDIKIDVARRAVAQRRLDPGEEPHRTQVDVLVEAAPQRDQQAPQRDMVRHLGVTDRAEINGVVEPQPLDPVLRHHHAHIDVALAAPVEFVPLEAETVSPRRRLHRGNPLGHHLAPDAVAGDHRDPIILCHADHPLCRRAILKS